MFSNLANCCKSWGELAVVDVGGGWGNKLPNCPSAMKRVNVAFRARMMSWKGRRGAWGVSVVRIGLRIFVRMGLK